MTSWVRLVCDATGTWHAEGAGARGAGPTEAAALRALAAALTNLPIAEVVPGWLSLAGRGVGLWGDVSAAHLDALRDEWPR